MIRRIKPGSIFFVAAALAAMLSAPALAGLYIPDAYASTGAQAYAASVTEEDTANNAGAASAVATPAVAAPAIVTDAAESGTAPADGGVDATAESAAAGEITVAVYDAETDRTMILGLEEYITGVVAGEMPVSFGEEALKAQAVAARSYALYRIAHGSAEEPEHHGAQLCTDSAHCKAFVTREALAVKWGEEAAEDIYTKVSEAVGATTGEIITYDGEAALAVFHSSSDGVTESAAAVWGGAVPYLVSVDTPETTDPDITAFTQEQIAGAFASDGVTYEGAALPELSYDDAGRVAEVDFGGVAVAGTRVRVALGLRSTDFSLVILDGEYIFTVRGYGHGVGMSQYGAAALAAEGADYTEILAHYYPGTVLTPMA